MLYQCKLSIIIIGIKQVETNPHKAKVARFSSNFLSKEMSEMNGKTNNPKRITNII